MGEQRAVGECRGCQDIRGEDDGNAFARSNLFMRGTCNEVPMLQTKDFVKPFRAFNPVFDEVRDFAWPACPH